MNHLEPDAPFAYRRRRRLHDLHEAQVFVFGLKHVDMVWLAMKTAFALVLLLLLAFHFADQLFQVGRGAL